MFWPQKLLLKKISLYNKIGPDEKIVFMVADWHQFKCSL